MNEFDTCFDIPDERDWKYEESEEAGVEIKLPRKFVIDNIDDYQNQGLEEITGYGCVFYSTTHGCNILNTLENVGDNLYSAKEFVLTAIDKGLLNPKTGANLQNGPKLARELKRISGWFLVNDTSIKNALFNGHPIVVGSNQLNFAPIILEAAPSYGHCILIIGWNETGYIIKESYGKEKWDSGRQYLPYNLFNKLYNSKYALIDEENTIITYRKKIMSEINIEAAKTAFEKGIWSGLNPQNPASREETAAMIMRAIEKLKNGML